jgi:ribosomal protein S18 acetylase RimI-like enzyme
VTFLITEAEPCDAVAINRVINAAYRVEDFFKTGDRTHVREVAEYLLHEAFLIAKDEEDDIAGVVRVSVDGERGHFGMLSVAPEVQGSGLGRLLMQAAEAFAMARGCTWMDLEVASPRVELPPFYERFGYQVTGRSEWPEHELEELKSPAHFVVMSKQLVRTDS